MQFQRMCVANGAIDRHWSSIRRIIMGMPVVPSSAPPDLDHRNAVAWVVVSVAYEELGLAHIINAEGEKIQKALGDIMVAPTLAEVGKILAVNESVRDTLETIICKECILNMKLGKALDYLDSHP
jgi:hypothetical protein